MDARCTVGFSIQQYNILFVLLFQIYVVVLCLYIYIYIWKRKVESIVKNKKTEDLDEIVKLEKLMS